MMKLHTHFGSCSALFFIVLATLGAMASPASAQYATGFEPPTFISGEISGQDLWTTSTNSATARVRTAQEIADELTAAGLTPGVTVHGGTQALIVSGPGASNATIRTISGLESERFVTLDVWARPLAAGTTGAPMGNIFLTMEDAAGTRAAAFRFGTTGGQNIDYGTSAAPAFPWQPSGVLWDSDSWYRLTISLDYLEKTYDFLVNGSVNATGVPFYAAGSANFSQIRIFRGANQAGMIVDDLMVVPEPATFACLLGGVALLLHRRKKR